jgi:hypothetical protein
MELKPGMIVAFGVDSQSFVSRTIARVTGSPWTHAFLVISDTHAVEAYFPQGVRIVDAPTRIAEARAEGRRVQVLDVPGLTGPERDLLAQEALRFVGRRYDVLQALYYLVFRKFLDDGPLRVDCIRLITAVYDFALGVRLFTLLDVARHPGSDTRAWQLLDGWATPGDLVTSSVLRAIDVRTDWERSEDGETLEVEDATPYFHITGELPIATAATPAAPAATADGASGA